MCVCVCVCVCDLYYLRGLKAFNVLAALATVLFTREIHVKLWRGMHIRAELAACVLWFHPFSCACV